jgi:hypothetical protein
MLEHAADGGDSGRYFLRSRTHDPAMHQCRRRNGRSVGLEIDRCQKRVHQPSEAPSARSLEVAAFDPFNVNTRLRTRSGSFGRSSPDRGADKRCNGLDQQRRLRCLCEKRLALRLPCGIVPLALRGGSAIRIGLKDALVAERCELLHIEDKDGRVPPHDWCATLRQHVQTRPDGAAGGRFALRSPLEHALLVEDRATGCRLRASAGVLGRVEHGRDDNIWICANQEDEIVVVDKTGKVIAKLGDFGGIDPQGIARGLLTPASLRWSRDLRPPSPDTTHLYDAIASPGHRIPLGASAP